MGRFEVRLWKPSNPNSAGFFFNIVQRLGFNLVSTQNCCFQVVSCVATPLMLRLQGALYFLNQAGLILSNEIKRNSFDIV